VFPPRFQCPRFLLTHPNSQSILLFLTSLVLSSIPLLETLAVVNKVPSEREEEVRPIGDEWSSI